VALAVGEEAVDEVHRTAAERELALSAPARVRRAREELLERRRHAARREPVHQARRVLAEGHQPHEAEHRPDAEVPQHVQRHAQRIGVEHRRR